MQNDNGKRRKKKRRRAHLEGVVGDHLGQRHLQRALAQRQADLFVRIRFRFDDDMMFVSAVLLLGALLLSTFCVCVCALCGEPLAGPQLEFEIERNKCSACIRFRSDSNCGARCSNNRGAPRTKSAFKQIPTCLHAEGLQDAEVLLCKRHHCRRRRRPRRRRRRRRRRR